jgi:hypothetical protein
MSDLDEALDEFGTDAAAAETEGLDEDTDSAEDTDGEDTAEDGTGEDDGPDPDEDGDDGDTDDDAEA